MRDWSVFTENLIMSHEVETSNLHRNAKIKIQFPKTKVYYNVIKNVALYSSCTHAWAMN